MNVKLFFRGPATRERVLFYIMAAGSVIVVPAVWTVALVWWPFSGADPANVSYRKWWLRAAVLLGAFDLILAGGIGIRSTFDEDFLPNGPARAKGDELVLGVEVKAREENLLVEKVLPGTAADAAGLREGDEITAVEGTPVRTAAKLEEEFARHGGKPVEISYFRKGELVRGTAQEPEHRSALRQGREAFRRNQLTRAREEFQRAVDLYPPPGKHVAALRGLAAIEERQGNTRTAAALIEEALPHAQPSERDPLVLSRVRVALRERNADDAAAWLSQLKDRELIESLEPAVLAGQGRTSASWASWLRANFLEPALNLSVVVAILSILCCRRRPPRNAARLILAATAALLLPPVLMGIAAALYGWAAWGNPFALAAIHQEPYLYAALYTLDPAAFLALTLLAHRWADAPPRRTRGLSRELRARRRLGWRPLPPRELLGSSLAGVCLLYGTTVRVSLVTLLAWGATVHGHPLTELAARDIRYGMWLSPLVAIAGPVSEEVFFRGFLFSRLRHRLGAGWTVAGTGLLFGSLHAVSIDYVFLATGLGLVLGYLRERTGSLLPPMLAHAAFNGINWSLTML